MVNYLTKVNQKNVENEHTISEVDANDDFTYSIFILNIFSYYPILASQGIPLCVETTEKGGTNHNRGRRQASL